METDAPLERDISCEPEQEIVTKPKRVLNEAQLRNLALGRKLAIEARKKKAVINKAAKLEVLEQKEELVEKAQETIERIETKRRGRPPKPIAPITTEPPPPPPVATPPPPNPRDEYYREKLRLLRERQEAEAHQQQWHTMYQRAPSSVHAADIARQSLMARANKAVLERAYREIFPDD